MNSQSTTTTPKTGKERKLIAIAVLIVSTLLLICASIVFIISGGEDKSNGEAAEKVFMTLIPLIGTWIGTVLAYYFSGENFQRATDSVTKLASQVAEERLKSTNVTEAMIPIDVAVVIRLDAADPEGVAVNLKSQILDRISDRVTRLPILDHTGRVKYILHESLIYKYISNQAVVQSGAGKSIDIGALTLKNLLDHEDFRSFAAGTITFVKRSSTLSEAKQQMENLNKCQDIFITKDGTPDSPVIGWITNVIITRYARA